MNRQPSSVESTIIAGIPADLPFVLQLKPWRHVWHHLRLPMALGIPFGLVFLAFAVIALNDDATTYHSSRYGDISTSWIGVIGIVLGIFMIVGGPLETAWRVSRAPVLGADRTGVYLQPRLVRTRTLYLPWELIESASIRRWRGPQLCLKPKEVVLEDMFSVANSSPAVGSSDRAGKRIMQKRMWKSLGTNISVPVGGAPQGPEGVLETLRQWSSGRI